MLRLHRLHSLKHTARKPAGARSLSAKAPNSLKNVIGIDLGTTNSAVAIMEGDAPRIIEDAEGKRTTPSVVAFDKNGGILVGQAAKRQALLNTENTFYATKRLIGRRFEDQEIQYDRKHSPYKIVESGNGDAWVHCSNTSRNYSPTEIGAFILDQMKSIAQRHLGGTVKNAVVTVPAYFNDSQRQATKNAGKIVGLNVLRVINEPTAAALAYGLDKTNDGIVVVFDLGGGTFDVSVLDIDDGVFEVRSTNGDTHLGGEDFDNLLVQHILAKFKQDTAIDLSGDLETVQRIKEAAEQAKIELSHVKRTTISLPFIKDNKHISMELTEDELDSLSMELINRTREPVRKALKDAELSVDEIDEVILVGGMTRMPKIRSTVEHIFHKKPNTQVNPDEAVALGAAIQGGVLSGEIQDVLLLDVTPLTLGIEVFGGVFSPLIPRNSTIPCKTFEIFSTGVDNQTGVDISVYQGERSLVKDNKLIGKFKLSGIPPLPKGVPQISVSFDIDADGIINVSAKEKTSGKETSITVIGNSGLTESEIEKIISEAEANKDADKLEKQRVQVCTNAELVVVDIEHAIKSFDQELFKKDEGYNELVDKIDKFKQFIANAKSDKSISIDEVRTASQQLHDFSLQVFKRVAKLQNEQKK